MTKKKLFSSAMLTACLSVCVNAQQPTEAPLQTNTNNAQASTRAAINKTIDQHTQSFLKLQPVLSTMLDIEERKAGGKYNNRMPNYSTQGMRQLQLFMQRSAEELNFIDDKALNDVDRLHIDTIKIIEHYYAGSSTFTAGYIDTWGGHLPYIVNQFTGPLMDIPKTMQVQQRIANLEDAKDYLDRLNSFTLLTDQILEKLKADEKTGVVLPKKLFPKTLTYFENFLSAPAKQHTLVTTFETRLNKINKFSTQKKQQLITKATILVNDVVYPGYRKIFNFMKQQQTRAPSNDGIWAQPGGKQFYLHEILYLADSMLDADTIHSIGLSEVARISSEMDHLLNINGYKKGSVGERMIALNSEPKFLYEDSDKGREKLIEDLNIQIQQIMAKTPEVFATIPKAKVEVRRIPVVSEAGEAGGFYNSPSLDGSRPGIYWINLRSMDANPSFSLKTLTYHEAVPGHHLQIALNIAQKEIGILRQNAPFNTYTEGWALYSEQLAKEMGMYENDPWGDLGRLQAELYRAVRLVVDTGLHSKKWTREQAIDYFYNTTGNPMSDVVAEVERYMVLPGQALGYKLGMLQFLKLREWARNELGDQFDIREFHDIILLPGARPMMLVKDNVEIWVKQKKMVTNIK